MFDRRQWPTSLWFKAIGISIKHRQRLPHVDIQKVDANIIGTVDKDTMLMEFQAFGGLCRYLTNDVMAHPERHLMSCLQFVLPDEQPVLLFDNQANPPVSWLIPPVNELLFKLKNC
jgi:hypothetical protein